MNTIWLASYPKSGSTWLRVLLANALSGGEGPVDINSLGRVGGIACERGSFEDLSLIDTGLLTHDEIDRLRPRLHEALARDETAFSAVRFVKVHDAYVPTREGEPLLAGPRGADGAIVIVRDPRDIAPSLAHHMASTIDTAIAFLSDAAAMLSGETDRQSEHVRQRLLSWSGHVASWLEQRDVPIHLVRYEAMLADPAHVLKQALAFAGLSAGNEAIERAVRFSAFGELRRQERETGFREALTPWRGGAFFRRGEAGGWRDELSPAQAARIEAAHWPMMRRLGYEPAAERAADG